jgi:hypothetical protein
LVLLGSLVQKVCEVIVSKEEMAMLVILAKQAHQDQMDAQDCPEKMVRWDQMGLQGHVDNQVNQGEALLEDLGMQAYPAKLASRVLMERLEIMAILEFRVFQEDLD